MQQCSEVEPAETAHHFPARMLVSALVVGTADRAQHQQRALGRRGDLTPTEIGYIVDFVSVLRSPEASGCDGAMPSSVSVRIVRPRRSHRCKR